MAAKEAEPNDDTTSSTIIRPRLAKTVSWPTRWAIPRSAGPVPTIVSVAVATLLPKRPAMRGQASYGLRTMLNRE